MIVNERWTKRRKLLVNKWRKKNIYFGQNTITVHGRFAAKELIELANDYNDLGLQKKHDGKCYCGKLYYYNIHGKDFCVCG